MKNILLLLTAMLFSSSAMATLTPTIERYELQNAAPSGTEGWIHSYNGNTGTGTLTDGIIGNSIWDTQLFRTIDGTAITVFLDDFYSLSSVTLFGGPKMTQISGQITEVTFSFPTLDLSFNKTGVPFGDLNLENIPINDSFVFSNPTPFVNQFTMSNFVGDWGGYYSITEIQVSAVSAIPEPSAYALMLGGLGLVGFMAMRRHRTA